MGSNPVAARLLFIHRNQFLSVEFKLDAFSRFCFDLLVLMPNIDIYDSAYDY